MSLEVKIQQAVYVWYISEWKCKKQGPNNVFLGENATSKDWMKYLQVKMQQVRCNWCI